MDEMRTPTQHPVTPSVDLRDMARHHIIRSSLARIAQSTERRVQALRTRRIYPYIQSIRDAVRRFYNTLPVRENGAPLKITEVSSFDKDGYRLENILFDSFPGWQVNATVYTPLNPRPPFPAVIIPVGHSGKQFKDYQFPAQFFAQHGYLAILFDPPGQAGEKQTGNDHFIDGVRCYLVGETSSQYFVADALRCIDYLETRDDVDLRAGVAMTGVSGGGVTTMLAGLLDPRVTLLGPSCCVARLADLDITQCYAGCPETHIWRRYAEGVDDLDLLCSAFPKPVLLMAGQHDEVFRIQDTETLAGEVAAFYQIAGFGERFEFFVDDGGHGYSLFQARQFTKFMDRWMRGHPDSFVPMPPESGFKLDPYPELQCHPRQDVNMRSLTLKEARKLQRSRDLNPKHIRNAAMTITGVTDTPAAPDALSNEPFQVWTHYWQQILLQPESGIELPGTFLYAEHNPTGAIIHFDDAGRNRCLYRNGVLTRAVRFLDRGEAQPKSAVLTIDLRGWGDSAPAMYPYEMAGWGSVDRCLAYMSAALGDPLMCMRIRDGLSALAYLRSRPEAIPEKIIVTGSGLGGLIALHVAAIDGAAQGVVIWDSLVSLQTLLETDEYTWPADTFIPNILRYYDLPELAASLDMPVSILRPLDGTAQPISAESVDKLNLKADRQIYAAEPSPQTIVSHIQRVLASD